MMNNIWVYIDHFGEKVPPTAWEVFGAAAQIRQALGGSITALVFGAGVKSIVDQAAEHGADEVILADDPTLAEFRPEPYASLLSKLAGEEKPQVILLPNSARGRDLAAVASVDLNAGLLTDMISLEAKDGEIGGIHPIYSGKLLGTVRSRTKPVLVTLRGRAFDAPAPQSGRSAAIRTVAPVVSEADIQSKVSGYTATSGGVTLSEAAIIVAGGRGVTNRPALTPPPEVSGEKEQEKWRAQQGFRLLEELADALGAAVGASRAVVDAGYIPYDKQVGQTGKVVAPALYIACGISGAIQHLAGMRTSKVIVAINKDANAPIFSMARFGVVGDLYDILPPLTQAIRKRLGKG